MEQHILQSLTKIKSSWELLSTESIVFDNVEWTMILENLIQLFRKNTFFKLVGNEKYYPQPTPNCRYYIKPNDGSRGQGIYILNSKPNLPIENYTVCPEIIPSLMEKDGKFYKYDYRVWIGIKSDLTYYICPTFNRRTSNIPFDITSENGSITNTALYSSHVDYQDIILYNKINIIVQNVLLKLKNTDENKITLTGWDFIENENQDVFLLEVNPNPSINIQHTQMMTEFLNWANMINKN
jgi:hypothetical protein